MPPAPIRVRGSAIPEAELQWRFSRSSGPGGQHVNTTDSRVELSFDLARTEALPPALKERALHRLEGRLARGVLTVTADERRSQTLNRQAARQRLADLLTEATAPPPRIRRATRPTRGSQERRIADKRRRGAVKRFRSGNPED